MEEIEVNQLADKIREASFVAHKYFKNGFLEKVYENSLRNRLQKLGINVKQQVPICAAPYDSSSNEACSEVYIV